MCRSSEFRIRSTEKKCAPGFACGRVTLQRDDEIRDFCRGQIATFKIPRYVRFVTEFPMTVTGKIQKFRMREQMTRELGLTAQKTA